ncbi:MAG: HAMP domain-containing histidine kinase [Clostridia bacterium]|nr:HAMP domain-containing histidine kinase [Clostridia bacterium]
MKRFLRRLPVKILCFILCIASLLTCAAGAFGATAFAVLEFYVHSEEYTVERITNTQLRGDAYDIVNLVLNRSVYHGIYSDDYSAENTNIRFKLTDKNGALVKSNLASGEKEQWEYTYLFEDFTEHGWLTMLEGDAALVEEQADYILQLYLVDEPQYVDIYAFIEDGISLAYSLRFWVFPITLVSFLAFVVFFCILMCTSARRADSDELRPGHLHRVPFDLMLVLFIFGVPLAIAGIFDLFAGEDILTAVSVGAIAIIALSLLLGICMSFAARIKTKTLFSNTVVWRVIKLCIRIIKFLWKYIKKAFYALKELFLGIPLIWRTIIMVSTYVVLDFIILLIAMEGAEPIALLFWLFLIGHLAFFALYSALFMRKLQAGGNALAKGDLAYKTDTKLMFWDFKKHGENLNSIADGMVIAVEERLQSERMKAELITNVSHDIKTPLTSIINYAGLISGEECDCEKHKEYSEVLVRKSEHLKRLLEDLVEISKATTGTLDVALLPCDANVLLTQAAGEFEQKCESAGLELIVNRPEQSVRINADSRRIWRVFENLMNNACKYSLGGSRVYLSLETDGTSASFVFRNTSKNVITVSPEELTERFVRGDQSRTSEGNGLGLSIAKSLTELQNGTMNISVDGDLFKVTLKFPLI